MKNTIPATVPCVHCEGRIPHNDEGVNELCPECGVSIFAAPEDLTTSQKSLCMILRSRRRVTDEELKSLNEGFTDCEIFD